MVMDGEMAGAAMGLPKFDKIQTKDPAVNLMTDSLEKTLTPVFDNPLMGWQLLKNIALEVGTNSITHKLGRKLVGWFITRQRGVASAFFDEQDTNLLPNLTLALNSSAIVVVDIYVY